jgi:hypothetical protein
MIQKQTNYENYLSLPLKKVAKLKQKITQEQKGRD